MSFPSLSNHCHHVEPPQAVSLVFQNTYCLTDKYRRCPVFAEKTPNTLPGDAAAYCSREKGIRTAAFWILMAVLSGMMFFLFGGGTWAGEFLGMGSSDQPVQAALPSRTAQTTMTMIATSVPFTEIPTQFCTGTATASPELPAQTHTEEPQEPTPTYTQIPCQPPEDWIPYTIQPGDTMYALALAYGISVQELREGNCMKDTYIWAGKILSVPNVPTRTPYPSATPTATSSPTETRTPTETSAATITPSPTATSTSTFTPTFTHTHTPETPSATTDN